MAYTFETIIIILVIAFNTGIVLWYMTTHQNDYKPNTKALNINYNEHKTDKSGSCTTICDALDPVSDPKYNMQQIIKQSILLEEHLTNKNKRCRDCITKHFLHIIGLAEEAQMLATDKIHKYPLINECVDLYNRLFNKWLKNYEIDHSNNDNF